MKSPEMLLFLNASPPTNANDLEDTKKKPTYDKKPNPKGKHPFISKMEKATYDGF